MHAYNIYKLVFLHMKHFSPCVIQIFFFFLRMMALYSYSSITTQIFLDKIRDRTTIDLSKEQVCVLVHSTNVLHEQKSKHEILLPGI